MAAATAVAAEVVPAVQAHQVALGGRGVDVRRSASTRAKVEACEASRVRQHGGADDRWV